MANKIFRDMTEQRERFWDGLRWMVSLFGFHMVALSAIFFVAGSLGQGTAVGLTELSGGFRHSLMAKELQLIGLGAVAHSLAIGVLVFAWRGRGSGVVRAIVTMIGIALLELGTLGGWMSFLKEGTMPTYRLIEFTLANLSQVVEHAAHIYFKTFWLAVIGTPLAIGGIWALFHFGYRRIPMTIRWIVGGGSAVGTILALNLSFVGVTVDLGEAANQDRDMALVERWLNVILRERTGPLTSVYCDYLLEKVRSAQLASDPRVELEQKQLSSVDQWAEQVDAAKAKGWNVLFVIVESLRFDVLMRNGQTLDIMPNVNALAEESVLWKFNYSQSTHSNYADISPISSQYPLRDPSQHYYSTKDLYPKSRLYDLLKTQGYRTGIVSSQNENWGGMISFLSSPRLDHYFHSESFDGDTYLELADTGFARMASNGKLSGKIDDRFTIDEAIRWIGESDEAPFYLYLNTQNSHFPYVVPEGEERPFAPEAFDVEIGFNNVPAEHYDVVKRRYWDSLHYTDTQLGRLFSFLKESGRWENTLVVLTGDTGQAFGEHGFTCHANKIFDEVLRTPVLFRVPEGAKDEFANVTEHIDVPPSILDVMGLPAYDGFQGDSAFAAGAAQEEREAYILVQTPLAHQYGIVLDGYKLIYDYAFGDYELYDLMEDPGETRDILREANPALVSKLEGRLQTWRKAQLDYYLDPTVQVSLFPPVLLVDPPVSATAQVEN